MYLHEMMTRSPTTPVVLVVQIVEPLYLPTMLRVWMEATGELLSSLSHRGLSSVKIEAAKYSLVQLV